ncbi:hypothetical protein [Kiloniella majae]|uniref:hypothetical protein n=1 Tax=Kiloniella majae TaxID=1938558 RepID=UPI000A277E95|nr:hypothetical protein [Kiloniella majae]
MKKWIGLTLGALLFTLPATQSFAGSSITEDRITLSYSDGSPETVGLKGINKVLRAVGVRVSTVPLPEEALPLLKASHSRAVTENEVAELLSYFELTREDLLSEIEAAGRKPTVENGGSLTTSEPGVAPYPKVYDMRAMDADTRVWAQNKFGPLHINHSKEGVGIDEVMTIVSGGPWVWFFELPGNVTGKLTFGYVDLDGAAWRVSYPGIRPHGGFLDPEFGLVIAYAHGPEEFIIHFDEKNLAGSKLVGTNPWIDQSGVTPKLLD